MTEEFDQAIIELTANVLCEDEAPYTTTKYGGDNMAIDVCDECTFPVGDSYKVKLTSDFNLKLTRNFKGITVTIESDNIDSIALVNDIAEDIGGISRHALRTYLLKFKPDGVILSHTEAKPLIMKQIRKEKEMNIFPKAY